MLTKQALLEQAVAAHQKGQLGDAEAAYRKVLALDPQNGDALHLLGVVEAQRGRYAEAVQWMTEAVRVAPDQADFHCDLANALNGVGRYEEALSHHRRAQALNPRHADSWMNCGNVLNKLERFDEALACLDKAVELAPDMAASHYNRAHVLKRMGRHEEALSSAQEAVRLRPQLMEARGLVIGLKERLGDYAGAWQDGEHCLALPNEDNATLCMKAAVLSSRQRYAEALGVYEQVLARSPQHAKALHGQAQMLLQLQRPDEALEVLQAGLKAHPNDAALYIDRGVAHRELGLLDESVEDLQHALSIQASLHDAYSGLATVSCIRNDFEGALAHLEQALLHSHGERLFLFQKATTLLTLNRWDEGWPLFEYRRDGIELLKARPYQDRVLKPGTPVAGKRVLVHWEQGFGDTIQFCRYAPQLAARGAIVDLVVQGPLVRLLTSLEGVRVLRDEEVDRAAYDYQVSLLSLPLVLQARPDTIPPAPYLRADAERVRVWQERLGPRQRPRIGLIWSSTSTFSADRFRSARLQDLLPFLPERFEYIVLQKDLRPQDVPVLQANPHIRYIGEQIGDFADTAALCSLVDGAVSTDTGPGHLAGALGLPTLMMLSPDLDWRWSSRGRSDSDWYPSFRLFWQSRLGDWGPVFAQVQRALEAW